MEHLSRLSGIVAILVAITWLSIRSAEWAGAVLAVRAMPQRRGRGPADA